MTRKLTDGHSLFLHIPRTGGTWVTNILRVCDLLKKWKSTPQRGLPANHTLLAHYAPYRLAEIDFVFTFVRHPLTYYESTWKWLWEFFPESLDVATRWRWHPHKRAAELYSGDFNTWVDRMVQNCPGWITQMHEAYVGPPNAEFVHFIGRTRTLKEDLRTVFDRLGLMSVWDYKTPEIDSIRRSNHTRSLMLHWKRSLKEAVLEQEQVTIERFFGIGTIDKRFYRKRYKLETESNASN